MLWLEDNLPNSIASAIFASITLEKSTDSDDILSTKILTTPSCPILTSISDCFEESSGADITLCFPAISYK